MRRVRRRFTPGSYSFRIRRSESGRGLFTEEPIQRGACIIEYTGRRATRAQMKADTGKYLFEVNKDLTIDGNIRTNTARFINHSCAPNCEIDIRTRRVFVFAKRNIKAGEELTYDYDTEYFDAHIKPKGCRCQKCLRRLRPANSSSSRVL